MVQAAEANWCGYAGPSLLSLLEQLPVTPAERDIPFAFPVQWVEKFSDSSDTSQGRRVFWGRVATGSVQPGQTLSLIHIYAPGHVQYTRNMVTAASSAHAAVVLVDATKLPWQNPGPLELLPQTRRHSLLVNLLRVPSIVFAVNKLDALDDPSAGFAKIRTALETFATAANIPVTAIMPISALKCEFRAYRIDRVIVAPDIQLPAEDDDGHGLATSIDHALPCCL